METKKEIAVAQTLNEKVTNVLKQDGLQLFEKAFVVSSAIGELKKMLTPEIMKPMMQLQNNKLGFKTDKPNGYDEETVKNCIIEATLSGFQVVGNQFNIIAGNMYGTKEGYGYLLKQMEGLHYEIVPMLPRINADKSSAAIVMRIQWEKDGKSFTREIDMPIKMNAYMGTDAVIGKATRKARAWLYNNLNGTEIGEGDVTDIDHTVVASGSVIDKKVERVIALIEQAEDLATLESYLPFVTPESTPAYDNKKQKLTNNQPK